jgi:hypothetical protein
MEEVFTSHEKRNLLGFEVKTEGRRDACRIVSIALADGRLLDRGRNTRSPSTASIPAVVAIIS